MSGHLKIVVALLLAGCVVETPASSQECFDDDDCDPGETCRTDEHLCYGNPPPGNFMAVLTPPADPGELVIAPAELTLDFDETSYGDFHAVVPRLVFVSGRIVLGDDTEASVGAQLTFRRPSRLPGAPDFLVNVRSEPGRDASKASFATWLQPTLPGEAYEITVVPDESTDGEPSPNELAPPYRQKGFTFVEDTTGLTFPLGGGPASVKRITGRVLDADGTGVEGLSVRAYGHFGPLDPLELGSSRGKTGKDGSFSVKVPVAWENDFELRFAPPSDSSKPEITLRDVLVPDPDDVVTDVVFDTGAITLPPLPAVRSYRLFIEGQAPEGGSAPPAGAQVTLTTTFVDQGPLTIRYRAHVFLDASGRQDVELVPGTDAVPLAYAVDVIPLADAAQASRFGEVIQVGAPGQELTLASVLPRRISLSGSVLDAAGTPQSGVTVRVAPSPRFLFDLTQAERGVDLTTINFPNTLTDETGHFSLWVDGELRDVTAGYTVLLEPPPGSRLPRWVIEDLVIAPDLTGGQSIGEQWLPDGALLRGDVLTAENQVVAAASLRVYEIVDDQTCVLTELLADVDCPPRSILRAQATSDDEGVLRLVLPRP